MKIRVQNLGVLKQADFTLGDLTIICGENNTGKTYATYALYGFLQTWRDLQKYPALKLPSDNVIDDLRTDGVARLNLVNYAQNAQDILNQLCARYSLHLPRIFSASEERFRNSRFWVLLEDTFPRSLVPLSLDRAIRLFDRQLISLTKTKGSEELQISLLTDMSERRFPRQIVALRIAEALVEIIFGSFFPTPFVVSAERTGAAIFRKELDFARNRLLKEISQADDNIDPRELLTKSYQDYPLPVEVNVDFTRQLERISKQRSFLLEEHSDVLARFAEIIGGHYRVTRNDELYFMPKNKRIRLSMDESASGVRSMLDIGFYLRHVAKRGDLLMVDEPELSLHPENQRRIARLFARLVKLGIRVFITTHSDYIIKELNTLIMLNQNKTYIKRIAKREGYDVSEFIDAKNVKLYVAEEALVALDGHPRRRRCQTLAEATVDAEVGIEARSFDKTIDTMNRIQDSLIWEED